MKLQATCAAVAAAFAALTIAGSASAQDVAFNAAIGSDYVFRGFSQTDEGITVQAGLDFATDGGWYAGAWASNVDFGDGTDVELDIYGGYRTEAAGWALDFGLIAYSYIGSPSGVSYDNFEIKAAASRAIGPATVGAAFYYSPSSWGVDNESLYSELNLAFAATDKISISGAIGSQTFDPGDDYTTWNVGGSFAFNDTLALDLRYHDTDVDNVAVADGRFVATLKAAF